MSCSVGGGRHVLVGWLAGGGVRTKKFENGARSIPNAGAKQSPMCHRRLHFETKMQVRVGGLLGCWGAEVNTKQKKGERLSSKSLVLDSDLDSASAFTHQQNQHATRNSPAHGFPFRACQRPDVRPLWARPDTTKACSFVGWGYPFLLDTHITHTHTRTHCW
jgi:hypothetical protein